jgi:hypothetical protein
MLLGTAGGVRLPANVLRSGRRKKGILPKQGLQLFATRLPASKLAQYSWPCQFPAH